MLWVWKVSSLHCRIYDSRWSITVCILIEHLVCIGTTDGHACVMCGVCETRRYPVTTFGMLS